jgi:hypothetical protein
VSAQFMRTLALQATAQTRVVTGTTGPQGEAADVYSVQLTLMPHTAQPRRWSTMEVLALPLLNQGIEGLVGRDLLSQMVLVYDGPRRRAQLTY